MMGEERVPVKNMPLEALLSLAATNVLHNTKIQVETIARFCHRFTVQAGQASAAEASTGRDLGGPAPPAEAAEAGGPAQDTSPLPHVEAREKFYRWKPHEVEVLLDVMRDVDPNQNLPVRKAVQALGWSSVPDPNHVLYNRVNAKLARMRHRMLHGEKPVRAPDAKRVQDRSMAWRAWLRGALPTLGDREFTITDVAAIMEAHPDISPLLDRRLDPNFKQRLRWESALSARLQTLPGVVRTGLKRGKHNLYRYNPTDPTAVPAKRLRQPKKGVPGLPHLGRHEGSKGDAADGQHEQMG